MTVTDDIDLGQLLADTETEILRVVGDRDPSTAGVYEMIRYHLGLDGSAGPRGKRMRPLLGLLAYASIAGEHARALPGAAAVELGHNFSLVHDDIEDGDVERRHRATLWALHGVPQAINTGDLIFSLSRVALHRLTDLGFSDAKVLRLMRLYDETCVMLCEGQYIDIAASASDEPMTVELYFDMIGRKTAALISASHRGRRPAGDRRRGGHHRLPPLRLGAGPRLPAQRRPARHLGPGADDRQGADGRRPPQEDAAGHVRVRARRRRRIVTASRSCTRSPSPATARSPRSWRSSSGPAPRTSPAPRRSATATSASRSSTRSTVVEPEAREKLERHHRRRHHA